MSNSRTGPGSPSYRLNYLLDELTKRFPDATLPTSSSPPEPKFLAEIDKLLAAKRCVCD